MNSTVTDGLGAAGRSKVGATFWQRLRPWQVVLVVCLIYLGAVAIRYQNVLEFVRLGAQYAGIWDTYSRDATGYDGQFAYYLALDPAHAADHLDVPAYHTQRILYPLLARIVSLGRADWLPYALLIINIGALLVGTALLASLLRAENVSRWYALSYGLFAGVLVAVRSSTTEPLAYALVIAAIWAAGRDRVVISAGLLLLAAFTKETTLLFAGGYALYYLLRRQWRRLLIVISVTVVPFAIWQSMLYATFGVFGIGAGGAGSTSFELLPFNGIWRIAADGPRVFLSVGIVPLAVAFLPTLWALWQTSRDLREDRLHPYVCLLFVNALVVPFLPFSTYREPLGLFRFLNGLLIAVLLYAAWHRAYRPLRYSLLWLIFGLLVLA